MRLFSVYTLICNILFAVYSAPNIFILFNFCSTVYSSKLEQNCPLANFTKKEYLIRLSLKALKTVNNHVNQ